MKHLGRGAVLLACGLIAAGCVPQGQGWASLYKSPQQPKLKVVMPAGAPSISQQFLFTTSDAKHLGIDVIGAVGDPVIAVADGYVAGSYSEPMYGNRVVVEHGPDATGRRIVAVYKHLDSRQVAKGTMVMRGQQLGTIGTTGVLGGGRFPHLHFEIYRQNGSSGETPTDPQIFWVNGPGQVTCFDPAITYDATVFRSTYPVPCRGQ
ncbi:M23 family metallopeptidase [Hoeflea sp. G2-23]|uniref:M23 family metallopeptidase n=1 Tax=Hoeflea algicola TaxID=2983763 RepID=A0ABT3ZDD3_9HYPH|nr:M23 family metallopeptidase [Hoeflea algicola]MCY0149738.1 M23 family metallopeptidase [Hoeflea algicola]